MSGTGKNIQDRIGIPIRRPQRYKNLPEIIRQIKAKSILEIGVCKGINAEAMIFAATETFGDVDYYGFDLFEVATKDILNEEVSPPPLSEQVIRKRLSSFGVNIHLYKGFSKDTLPEFFKLGIKPDFIFIDGGHSYETVKTDWLWSQRLMHKNTVVIFDDYIDKDVGWGCNKTIASILNYPKQYKVEFLEPPDSYHLRIAGTNERILANTYLVKVTHSG